ncbi:MAG: bifunctional pyr operon transcriptional regulator/uracil phosphoribosyltransferase PyrR [Planctomycetaceae bacterium]|nr:bifunctional pyr operon transcriptional regulator/uracil phosphoribosyltransferase PyrR [Planctomycetaceae bacterium]
MKKILNAVQVQTAVKRLFEAVAAQLPAEGPIAVVGIRTRGETLAARIVNYLREQGRAVEHGVLDITFYRDDLSRSRGAPLVKATEINFDLDNAWTLLVDDVLNTGRSIRAALDALHDFGRPSVVRLAVLIDRGGRELPIAADFVGKTIKAPPQARVQVQLEENDGEEAVYIIQKD